MNPITLALAMIATPAIDQDYQEELRPQFHFTARKGWLNDPNGLVFYKGEYHLFFQHNPFGTEWGNMTWGHAVSKDLLHWTELDSALEPDGLGTMYSGSAVVDKSNTLNLFYTAAGGNNEASKGKPFTQCLATSTDGRKFTKFAGNPIVPHIEAENRDPKVIWHESSKQWVMALYLNDDRYELLTSKDLKSWTKIDDVAMPGASECPDFFELPVDGKKDKKLWVFWSANGKYRLGAFDGHKFSPSTGPLDSNYGANCYAAQTYSEEPRGRRVQFGWMQGGSYPKMPFNQQMTVPRELRLISTPDGPRIATLPVDELKKLRLGTLRETCESGLLEVRATLLRDRNSKIVIEGATIEYDASAHVLRCLGRTAPIRPEGGPFELIAYRDRTSLEIFADRGLVSMPFCFVPTRRAAAVTCDLDGMKKFQCYELKSCWP